jgi:hypothetical protein
MLSSTFTLLVVGLILFCLWQEARKSKSGHQKHGPKKS